jgi:hypothetical protein
MPSLHDEIERSLSVANIRPEYGAVGEGRDRISYGTYPKQGLCEPWLAHLDGGDLVMRDRDAPLAQTSEDDDDPMVCNGIVCCRQAPIMTQKGKDYQKAKKQNHPPNQVAERDSGQEQRYASE